MSSRAETDRRSLFKTDAQVDKALERNPLNDWHHRFKAHSRPFSIDEEGFPYQQSTAF